MKRLLLLTTMLMVFFFAGFGQQYSSRTGFIGFYSKSSLEDIKAENNQVYVIIDAGKKNIALTLLLKSFTFEKELMQVHFNENYVESDKYPKSSFVGSYTGDVPLDKNGVYNVTVKGNLSLHQVTRAIEMPATLEVKGGKILGNCTFKVRPEDYNISIPSIVRDKIAQEITVVVKIDCNSKN
jgi:YceI-like domain